MAENGIKNLKLSADTSEANMGAGEIAKGGAGAQNGGRAHGMLPPFTAARQFTHAQPLVITRSEGIYVFDNEGNKYLDALAGLWSTAAGGSEPRLVDAAAAQMRQLPFYHSFWNRTTEPAIELAKVLVEMFTAAPMAQVHFTNSGSEANDTQVKLVWYYNNARGRPDKKKFIARQKAYHGSTIVSASLTGLPAMHKSFDLPLPFVRHTDCPHYWRYARAGESEEDFSARLAGNLEKLILDEGPDTVAAFIAEPLMGAGGVIPPPKGYWEAIQAVLKKYDVLLIADEVVCGFGRLGTWFGSDYYGIRPDLVTFAKALSSAYLPIAAVMISGRVADDVAAHSDQMGSFAHGFTYAGHPVSCAVALEAIKIYKERDYPGHVKEMEPLFQGGMRDRVGGSPIVGEVRGVGLIMGIEFVADKGTKAAFPPAWGVGPFFAAQTAERGMLVRTVGDIIAMSPPLVITAAEIEELISIFVDALKVTEEYVQKKQSEAA